MLCGSGFPPSTKYNYCKRKVYWYVIKATQKAALDEMAAEQNFLHNVHNVFALLRIDTSNMDEEHSRQVVL